jgi:hypothetical protein
MALYLLTFVPPLPSVRLFSLPAVRPLCILRHHTAPVRCVAFGEHGVFASTGEDSHVALWNVYADSAS